MQKKIGFILSLSILVMTQIACDSQKTNQERIREEKRAIERFIDKQGIRIVNEYPENGQFEENQYFKTSSGLYLHVVNPGDTTRRVKPLADEVQVRFDYRLNIIDFVSGKQDTIAYNYRIFPLQFVYGQYGSYSSDPFGFVCEGFAVPLAYVGEGAVVDLIIPSLLGSSVDNSVFNPVFYKGLRYTKFF